jgi:hypothetical protein
VVEVAAYRTLQPEVDQDELRHLLERVSVVTFTSSSTVRNLAAMADDLGLKLAQALSKAIIACIGPITAQTARDLALPVHVMAQEYTIDGLVEALVRYSTSSAAAGPRDGDRSEWNGHGNLRLPQPTVAAGPWDGDRSESAGHGYISDSRRDAKEP